MNLVIQKKYNIKSMEITRKVANVVVNVQNVNLKCMGITVQYYTLLVR